MVTESSVTFYHLYSQGKRAELHLSKFGNGTSGKSIKYKGDWMTPEDYEQVRL